MATRDDEESLLHSVALQNAQSILLARRRAEQELVRANEALEARTEELARSLSMMTATLESTTDAILATDEGGRVTCVNENFVEMWRLPRELVDAGEHRPLLEVMGRHLHDPPGFLARVDEIAASSPPETFDLLTLADGRVVERYSRIQEVEDREVGRVWSFRDVTERARTEAALRGAKEEAETANRAKSEFLAVMSHELRTPLNAIGGYADLIEMGIRGPVTPAQREDLRRIQTSQRHLLGLINEVLNYAKLETGTVQYDLADIRVRDVLAAAEGLISPQVWTKGLTLTVAECPGPLAVRADGEKLRQVLVNLLSNAVKFTLPGGRVELTCSTSGDQVCLAVGDTGIGIPEEKLEAIFEPFVQVRSDLTRTAEGTGLGLSISRDLARGMGGDLTAESTLGVGSTFSLRLPAA
ncbi:MAG TPA: PAS domain-containing sensor histidine kinase [Longimicrobium sp.]|jgi:signal transduction histidine kinase|nr:PAS domain-containing sensor histidine kinase [Longimicrobium sp.]